MVKPLTSFNWLGNSEYEIMSMYHIEITPQRVFSFVVLLLCFIGSTLGVGSNKIHAQSGNQDNADRIEKKIPRELLAKPHVATDVERLRALRKNAALFGKKHPAFASTEKQIAELESKLAAVIHALDEDKRPENLGSVPEKPDTKDESAKRLDLKYRQDAQTDFSKIEFGTDFRLVLAYPLLELPELVSVGVFPGLGLMWGIEFDLVHQKSRIWQWHDLSEVSSKSLYFETDGVIEAIAFPSDVQEKASLFMLIRKQDREDATEIFLSQIAIDPLPPFSTIEGAKPTAILQAKTNSRDRNFMISTANQGLLLFCNGEILDAKTDAAWEVHKLSQQHVWSVVESNQILSDLEISSKKFSSVGNPISKSNFPSFAIQTSQPEGFLDVLYLGNALFASSSSRLIADPKSGNVCVVEFEAKAFKEIQTPIATTTRGILGVFYDTTNEPLLLDGFGQLLTFERLDNKATSIDQNRSSVNPSQLPRLLSQTKWFDDMARGRLSSDFVKYEPAVLYKDIPKNVMPEFFLSIPKEMRFYSNESTGVVHFPPGSVLLQNFKYFPTDAVSRYIATLGLVRTEFEWIPFVYEWNFLQDDAMLKTNQIITAPIVSSQQELDFFEVRKKFSIGNCISCHQGPKAFGGLGVSNAKAILEDSLENQSIELSQYLTKRGYLQKQ